MEALTRTFIEEHYRKNFDRLVKLFTRRSGTDQDAEDIVQQGYLRVLRFAHTYEPDRSFDAWFNRILMNVLKEYKNKCKTGISFDEEEVEGTPDNSFNRELWNQIIGEIPKVSDKGHQEVLRLYFIFGMNPRDIVKITGYRYKNTVTILDRFKTMIKEKYA